MQEQVLPAIIEYQRLQNSKVLIAVMCTPFPLILFRTTSKKPGLPLCADLLQCIFALSVTD
jgi:hypothetical protein